MDRTEQIIASADRLRSEVEAMRKDIEARKAMISRRKSDLASASNGISARRSRLEEDAERSIQMTRFKWNRNAELTAATRSFLCAETGRLYGLRRYKKGNAAKYEIAGVEIVELPSLAGKCPSVGLGIGIVAHAYIAVPPEVVSTCLAHIAHILMLASHYLLIRLPAEITLPHRDYPRPTILPLASSYQQVDMPFPGASGGLQTAPTDSRSRDQQRTPRLRPLFIDKPLPVLAKEDPSAYSLFIEAVTLLAYDISWACCSQGVPIGDKDSFDDVCSMGRNLYNLLIGNQAYNNPSGRIFPVPSSRDPSLNDGELGDVAQKPLMGRYSHGTAHDFLGTADGQEFIRSFKIPSPIKLADRLKKKLSNDAPIPDWEVLEDDAWAPDDAGVDDGVLVKGHREKERGEKNTDSDGRFYGVDSVMTVRSAADAPSADTRDSSQPTERALERGKGSGTSGWTKVKNR